MSLRVLILPYPGEILFGAERSLLVALEHLDRGRVEASVATLGETAQARAVHALGVPCLPLASGLKLEPGQRFPMWRYAPALMPLVRSLRRTRPHLLYGHSNDSVLIGAAAARLCRIPFAWSPRCSHGDLGAKRRPVQLAARLGVDALLAPSRAVEASVGWLRTPLRRVIYAGVDTRRFRPGPPSTALRERLGAGAGELLVASVGQLAHFKGTFDFIRAAGMCHSPRLRFALVGSPVRASIPAQIAAAVLGCDLEARMRVEPYVDDPVELLRSLDILCVPSRWNEALARVVLEAQAVGIPVIGARVGGVPEVIEHGVTGLLVPSASPRELSVAIDRLAAEPELRRRLVEAAQRRVLERFSAATYARSLETAFEDVVSARSAARSRRAP